MTSTQGGSFYLDNVKASIAPESETSLQTVYTTTDPQDSLLTNGHFNSDIDGWYAGNYGTGASTVEWNAGGWLDHVQTVAGTNCQIRHNIDKWLVNNPTGTSGNPAGVDLAAGDWLTVTYRAKASADTKFEAIQIANNSIYFVSIGSSAASITTEWQSFSFSAQLQTSGALATGVLCFVSKQVGWTGTISLDDVRLFKGRLNTAINPSVNASPAINYSNIEATGVVLKEYLFTSHNQSTVTTSSQPAPTWVSDGAGGGYITQTFADGALNNSWWLVPFPVGAFPIPYNTYYLIKLRVRGTPGATIQVGHVINGPPYYASAGDPPDGDGTTAITLTAEWQDVTVLHYRTAVYTDSPYPLGPYVSLSGTQTGTVELDQLQVLEFNNSTFVFDPDAPVPHASPAPVFNNTSASALPSGSTTPTSTLPNVQTGSATAYDNTEPQSQSSPALVYTSDAPTPI
jgi:hypothetical protein